MNELKVFSNTEFGNVRVLNINDRLWFVGIDVAKSLGYKNSGNALSKYVSSKNIKTERIISSKYGERKTRLVNEFGIKELMNTLEAKNADKFLQWVLSDIFSYYNFDDESLLTDNGRMFGYMTITNDEKEDDMQIKKLRHENVDRIFMDFNGKEYSKMISILQKSDTVVVCSYKAFGDNYETVLEKYNRIKTKSKIKVLNADLLKEIDGLNNLTYRFMQDMIFAVTAYQNEMECFM